MDIFVEPVLPHPSLIILGVSPVALSLATQARQLGYHVTVAAPAADLPGAPDADMLIDGYQLDRLHEARRFIVVSTQGKGDEAALRAAVTTEAAYHAFVGSRRKMAALARKTDRGRHRRRQRSIASRRRPASISAPSRRKKSRCRSWPRSRSSGGGDSAER